MLFPKLCFLQKFEGHVRQRRQPKIDSTPGSAAALRRRSNTLLWWTIISIEFPDRQASGLHNASSLWCCPSPWNHSSLPPCDWVRHPHISASHRSIWGSWLRMPCQIKPLFLLTKYCTSTPTKSTCLKCFNQEIVCHLTVILCRIFTNTPAINF